MEERAAGAAAAARTIANRPISEAQRQRVARLTGEPTKRAWLEPQRRRNKSKSKILTDTDLWFAYFELFGAAFDAADYQPIGSGDVEQEKRALLVTASLATGLRILLRKAAQELQLAGLWGAYRNRSTARVELPTDLDGVVAMLGELAEFFEWAAPHYKPAGPVPPTGKPKARDALKTTVIHKISATCKAHFGSPLLSTTAILANASLDRTDIDRAAVQGSLRRL
jgi:hypothetical protein